MWISFLQGLSFATAPLLSFGPFKIFVLSQALQQGWRRSLPLALAPLAADSLIILLVWLVLRQLPDWSVNTLRLTGGLFYIYLAYGLIQSAREPLRTEALERASRRTFWQAITAIWVTPQAYINWSLIGVPALLVYAEQSSWHVLAFLFGFYLLFLVGLAVQIIVVGQAGKVSPRANTYLLYGGALFLVGFGVFLLWNGSANLLNL
jgi:threonine/homoserine/homoserine lactone efflux protein